MRIIIALISFIVIGISCENIGGNVKFLKDEAGYEYRFIKEGGEQGPVEGKYFMYSFRYFIDADSILFASSERPTPMGSIYIKDGWQQRGQFFQFLEKMHVGDSAIIVISVEDFFSNTLRKPLPKDISRDEKVTVEIGVFDILSDFELRLKSDPEARSQYNEDIETLNNWLAENNIDAGSSENGVRYVIHEKGDGALPEVGDNISVHYTGALLDGTEFDTSVGKDPISFQLGVGQVILGWDEGLQLFNVGTKATIYIPSTMAYGSRGAGDRIAPNSILKFDVEVVGIN